MSTEPVRLRREPPPFRVAVVTAVAPVNPRLVRISLGGDELAGFAVPEPAASVRLLLPSAPDQPLTMPAWNGNEFLLPGGSRPVIRTLTPLASMTGALDVEVVVHGSGPLSAWASAVEVGATVAVSGPGRGYRIPEAATELVLAGDESALPAIVQLLGVAPAGLRLHVIGVLADAAARRDLAARPAVTVDWVVDGTGASLASSVRALTLTEGTHLWVAGEAAEVQRARRHLFDERGLPRSRAVVRGYWKRGRAGDDEE